ncbi:MULTISPECIES: mannitol dehydrogenase family protein [unclassified Microbacterium]|uniref:mannitol dehydrogenase family protein n=1 Tax=unclassified Microbacterium TaxID=2609290 RepID=UPI003016D5D2
MTVVPLAEATTLPRPEYARDPEKASIVHFGLGNFHRAHQAMYLDRLLAAGETDGGICGVGVLPSDVRMRDALAGQDHLYTLVLKAPDGGVHAQVIGSVVDYLFAPENPSAVVDRLADPVTRIVSLTITEGGYVLPEIEDPSAPSAFSLIVDALARRRDAGAAPFTVMSCDNLQDNGRIAARVVIECARNRNEELAAWIEQKVAFPCSMVDRITPTTTEEDRALLRDRFGVDDAWPVVAEPFAQWVLEDRFTDGRPSLEKAGVQVVDDVRPYELMKLRLLNASHQALAYFGMLLGHTYAHETASDPLVQGLLRAYMAEARMTLAPVPGIDLDEYQATLLVRFSNPAIADTLERLGTDSINRMATFVLPVLEESIAAGRMPRAALSIVTAWMTAKPAQSAEAEGATPMLDRLLEDDGVAAALAADRRELGAVGAGEFLRRYL